MEAQPSSAVHVIFTAAQQKFAALSAWLAAHARTDTKHDAIEMHVLTEIREIGRSLIQAHMDLRTERERLLPAPETVGPRARPRRLRRKLDTVLGTVQVARVAWQTTGETTVIPLDQALGLPVVQYSFGVQRLVAEQAETMSFDRAGTALGAMGMDVPKRQREQIVVRMAQDFEAFYAERPLPANDTVGITTLNMMSVDSVGVRVVPHALREDTRKAAEKAAEEFVASGSVRGDPMAPRIGHTHDHRMAVVTLNWDQTPRPRTSEDITEQFKPRAERSRDRIDLPRPGRRRVRATLKHSQREAIVEMFDEAARRDPRSERRWVVLIDGSDSQREQVLAEARRRDVPVDLVLDLIHALHYLWDASKALHGGTTEVADAWVKAYVERLLTRPVSFVISGLRRIASDRGTAPKARKALRKCADYFDKNALGMDYAASLKRGYPIATGNVEGACRHLVRDRMDITGARWSLEGAEAMLKVRSLMKSDDWDEYCRFHFRQEHARAYLPIKKAA